MDLMQVVETTVEALDFELVALELVDALVSAALVYAPRCERCC